MWSLLCGECYKKYSIWLNQLCKRCNLFFQRSYGQLGLQSNLHIKKCSYNFGNLVLPPCISIMHSLWNQRLNRFLNQTTAHNSIYLPLMSASSQHTTGDSNMLRSTHHTLMQIHASLHLNTRVHIISDHDVTNIATEKLMCL